MHVDAASGGFVVPFLHPDLPWDFRLPRVVSINVSGHKYGLTYRASGSWCGATPNSCPRSWCSGQLPRRRHADLHLNSPGRAIRWSGSTTTSCGWAGRASRRSCGVCPRRRSGWRTSWPKCRSRTVHLGRFAIPVVSFGGTAGDPGVMPVFDTRRCCAVLRVPVVHHAPATGAFRSTWPWRAARRPGREVLGKLDKLPVGGFATEEHFAH